MNGHVSLFKKPSILIVLFILFSFSSLMIVVALFMGQEAGNFVIEVESGDVSKNLHIAESISSHDYVSRLEVPAFEGMSHSTYERFEGKIDDYINTDGVYMDKDLHIYAYTFYILNNSEEAIDIQSTMFFSNVTKELDSAIRVMTITEQAGMRCYQLPDEEEVDYGANYPPIHYFNDKDVVYKEDFLGIQPNSYVKYTMVFWLEGNDLDCNDDRRMGTIRFLLKIAIL